MSELISWRHLTTRRDWEGKPVDYVNASQIKLVSQGAADGLSCTTAWAIRYLFGKTTEKVQRGPLLGTFLHRAARHYHLTGSPFGYQPIEKEVRDLRTWATDQAAKHGGSVDDWCKVIYDEAIKRLKPGLAYQPRLPNQPQKIEEEFRLYFEGLLFGGTTDIRSAIGPAVVVDHKTTRGARITGKGLDKWFYVPTVDELARDPQCLLYMLKCAQEHPAQHYVKARWIYYLTDEKSEPEAKIVEVYLDRFEVESRFRKHCLPWARHIKAWVDHYYLHGLPPLNAFTRPALPGHEKSPCRAYGWGCDNGNHKGGPCQAFNADPQAIGSSIAATELIER